jgi:hypothetical protein
MLNKTLEFIRIADVQPTDDKVRRRTESATELVAHLAGTGNRDVLLAFLQGTVVGFDGPLFTQDSPAVVLLVNTIKAKDATLPFDLKENAIELRAVAAIAVGELLTRQSESHPTDETVLAALSMRSALSSRPTASNKHICWMLDTLLAASDKVLYSAGQFRRKRGTRALRQLDKLEKPADANVWEVLMPAFKSALLEASVQEAVDREEIETLWWMFTAYSEVEQKPLAELSPLAAAFCCGIELAQRALLPPSPSTTEMVKRAVESGRKPATLASVALQDATAQWSEAMISRLCPGGGSADEAVSAYPALLPIAWACSRLRECRDAPRLGKDFTASTGVPLSFSQPPASWGAQVFREKIVQRVLLGAKET